MTKKYRSGELAKRVGINVQTLRYYERRGMMPKPQTRESGYREYTDTDLARLQFIIHAKEIGFSLREIADLLSLRVSPHTTCEDVRLMASKKIGEIDERLAHLERLRRSLLALVEQCKNESLTGDCPILGVLERSDRQKRKG